MVVPLPTSRPWNPGSSARTQRTAQAQRGFGNQMTISGGRPRQNDARLDGISVNDYVNGPPGSALGVSLGSDAVEQFSCSYKQPPGSVCRSSGGIIGASTRSGTANFHGNAERNSLMFSTTRISLHHSIFEISLIRQEVQSATRDGSPLPRLPLGRFSL